MNNELINHRSKCRLCFQRIGTSRNTAKLTDADRRMFFSLTNIELKISHKFSSSICKSCDKSLTDSFEFRHRMIDNQRRLYAFEEENSCTIVKTEPEDPEAVKEELMFGSLSNVKTEIFEDFAFTELSSIDCEQADDDWFSNRSDKNEDFFCDICGYSTTLKSCLSRHMNTRHLTEKVQRPVIKKVSSAVHKLKRDSKICGEFACEECGKVFAKLNLLKAHKKFKHQLGEYKCKKCGVVFDRYKHMSNHRKTHYDLVPCEICGKQVQRGSNMTIHLLKHGPPKFKCTFEGCSAAYLIKPSLQYHILNIHTPKETIKCPKCDATFPNVRKLKKHDQRTHGERKYICPVEHCTYRSTRRDYFRVHLKTHRNMDVKVRDEIIAKADELRGLRSNSFKKISS